MSQQVVKPGAQELLQQLRQAGLKVTAARQAVIDAVVRFDQPFTAEDVLAKLYHLGHQIHRATVYRDILLFAHAGLLKELSIQGSQAHYYELASQTHHHHFICRSCLTIIDVIPTQVEEALRRYEAQLQTEGLQVEYHQLKFYGRCPRCQAGSTDQKQ